MDPSLDAGNQKTKHSMERVGRANCKKGESCGISWEGYGDGLLGFEEDIADRLPARGTTITAERYCEVLKKLKRAIQNKRRGKLTKTVFLIHDNARPHSARQTQQLREEFRWDVFGHPPYSPDLAPSDFHLFPQLKQHLGGRRFANEENLKEEVQTWLTSLAAEWYDAGLKKLLPRYQKCFEIQGDYVEK